jgi:hypothetical protein
MTRQEVISAITGIQRNCSELMQIAKTLSESPDPKQRALAYEISISVSKITAEQKIMLKELQEMELNKTNK